MKKFLGILAITLAYSLALYLAKGDEFLGDYNRKNQMRLAAFLAILAMGEAVVIISGGIDLSIGSIVCLTATLVTYWIGERGWPAGLAVAAAAAIMLAVGLAQGLLVARAGFQPFVATLGGYMILRGAAMVLSNGGTVTLGAGHAGFERLGKDFILGALPVSAAIMLAVAALAGFVLHFTVYGRHLYALGRNEEAARFSGVNVRRVKTLAYAASAGLACLAGVLYSAYLSSVQSSTLGISFELYAIAAAVLGGCSLRGGEGNVAGIVVGAAFFQIIRNSIILLGIPSHWELIVVGGVILAAAMLDLAVRRPSGQRG